jgi:hypothetical protein
MTDPRDKQEKGASLIPPREERCPSCGHDWARLSRGRGLHVACWRCARCDRWLRWVPKAAFAELTAAAIERAMSGAGEPK